jgi:hypothetical protein
MKKRTVKDLADTAREAAALNLDPEVRRIVANLDHDPRDAGNDIEQNVSAADILRIARAARKEEDRMTTKQMIAEVAKCKAAGRPYWPVALRLRPDLPLEKAKHYLRSRVSKNRLKIDAEVRRLRHK